MKKKDETYGLIILVVFVILVAIGAFIYFGSAETAFINSQGESLTDFKNRLCPSNEGAGVWDCGSRSDGSAVYCVDGGSKSCQDTFNGICESAGRCSGGATFCTYPDASAGQYYCDNNNMAIKVCDPPNSGFSDGWAPFEFCEDCETTSVQNSPTGLCQQDTKVFCYRCNSAMDGNVDAEEFDSCTGGWSSSAPSIADCTDDGDDDDGDDDTDTCADKVCNDNNPCTGDTCADGLCIFVLKDCGEGRYCDTSNGDCIVSDSCEVREDCQAKQGYFLYGCVDGLCEYTPDNNNLCLKTYHKRNADGKCVIDISKVFGVGLKEFYDDYTTEIIVSGIFIVVIIGLLLYSVYKKKGGYNG